MAHSMAYFRIHSLGATANSVGCGRLHERFAAVDLSTVARQQLGLKRLTATELLQIAEAPVPTELQLSAVPPSFDNRADIKNKVWLYYLYGASRLYGPWS